MELQEPPIPPTASDADERRRRAFADVEEFTATTYERSLCKKTKAERERAWALWNRFVKEVLQLTPEEADNVWFGVCQNKKKHIAICKSFLADYKRYARCKRLNIDGPEEYKEESTVRSVLTIIALWKHIVAQADGVVLAKRRDQDSNQDSDDDTERWTLFGNRGRARKEIIQWIESDLARKSDLSRKQTFVKTEATTDDILLILSTLWERADDIPCDPRHRLAFHTMVLIASIGFRPGTLENMLYQQVKLLVVRDPDTNQPTLVADITINQNKLSANKFDKGADVVTFYVTMESCPTICLTTFVAIQALQDDAFESNFSSLDELLQRPNLEDVDCIELRWKEGMQQKPIFPLKYYKFLELFNRTWLVAGNRTPLRPYALRIGGGKKMDAFLTSADRNHILSHSTNTFQTSYTPRRIPYNLMSMIFNSCQDKSKLYDLLASASLRRDDKAPLYPTAAMLERFQNRQDMKTYHARRRHLREKLKLAADDPLVKQLTAKIGNLQKGLSELGIKQLREEYYAEVDSLRARGLSTADMPAPPTNPQKVAFGPSLPAAKIIGRFFRSSDQSTQKRLAVPKMIIAYLNRRYSEVAAIAQAIEQTTSEHKEAASTRPTCLICLEGFSRQDNLSRHHWTKHFTITTFTPFSCPQCQREGNEEYKIEAAKEWSNHVERVHGSINTPSLREPDVKPKITATTIKSRSTPCLRCGQLFFQGSSLSRHMSKYHKIEEPFDCPTCKRGGNNIQINDLDSWLTHTADVHGCNGQTGVVIDKECLLKQGQKKRKRETIVEKAIKRTKSES